MKKMGLFNTTRGYSRAIEATQMFTGPGNLLQNHHHRTGVFEVSYKLIGGIGSKWGNAYQQQNRIYEGTTTTIETHNCPYWKVNMRIRKLTPKECWRLMDFPDEAYEKAAKVNSKTQLYKQAGNSIVVGCLEAIFRNLLLDETEKPMNTQLTIFDYFPEEEINKKKLTKIIERNVSDEYYLTDKRIKPLLFDGGVDTR